MTTYLNIKFYSDPGHGWLAVKRKLIEEYGIADQISSYSYQKGASVYLEEDCDAGKFLKAVKDKGILVNIEERHTNNRSPIRSYESFKR